MGTPNPLSLQWLGEPSDLESRSSWGVGEVEREWERKRERGELWVSLRAHVTVCDWLPWRGFGWAERYCSVGVIRLLFLFSFNGVKQYQVIFCLKCAVFLQQTSKLVNKLTHKSKKCLPAAVTSTLHSDKIASEAGRSPNKSVVISIIVPLVKWKSFHSKAA